jgi:outer membrane protein
MMRPTLVLAALLFSLPALAGTANLSALYQMARENDAEFAAARENYRAGLEKLPQGRAGLLPTLNLGANTYYNQTHSSVPSMSDYGSRSITLTLRQPIYRKQNLEAYEQAKVQILMSEQELKLAEQKLLLSVAKAYFDVLQAQDVLATAQAQKQAYAEQLAQARKSFEVGAATITDTHEAQARYDLTTAQEIAAQNDLEVKRRSLEKIINRESPDLARLGDDVQMALPAPNKMEVWAKQAEEDSVSVHLNQSALELARREVAKQRGGHLPTLDLAANYGDSHNPSPLSSYSSRTGAVGLEFGWLLYQGGSVDSHIREAVALQEKSRNELDSARRQARLDARQGFLGVVSGDAQVRALEQALVSSQMQLKSTKLGLEVGVRTRIDVLNAEQQLFTTKRDLAAARYQTLVAGLQLKAAAGSLNEEDLKAVDALLK